MTDEISGYGENSVANPMDDVTTRAIVWDALYDLTQLIEGNTEAGTIDGDMTHDFITDAFDVVERAVRGTLRVRPRESAILDQFRQELDKELSSDEQQKWGMHVSFDSPGPPELSLWTPGTLHAKAVFQNGRVTWTMYVYPHPGEHWVVTRTMPQGEPASPLPRSSDDPNTTVVRKETLRDTLQAFVDQTRREIGEVS